MKYLNIDSTLSLSQLEEGVEFTTFGHAPIECTVEYNCANFEICKDFVWTRDDIKELIQFLKAVRKLIPKDDE